jgi:hypothetical protein
VRDLPDGKSGGEETPWFKREFHPLWTKLGDPREGDCGFTSGFGRKIQEMNDFGRLRGGMCME